MTAMRPLILLFAIIAALLASPASAAESEVGIILLHGKWDRPPTNILVLQRVLEAKGFLVATPGMPWSGLRLYDADYPAALAEIEASANALRKQGAKRILVGGHSFGANAAIAYAASGREADGLIAIAPGHTPDQPAFRKAVGASLERAREMLAAGRGEEKDSFDDLNQGKSRSIRMTARIYCSYFDPEGMAAMPLNADRLARPLPVLWVIGQRDRLLAAGKEYVFDRLPAHPASRYLVVDSDHMNTPTDAATQIAEWVSALAY